MTDTYRTPGREIDETEVETTRIRETEATKRKALELREASAEVRRKRFWEFMGYDGTLFIVGTCAVVMVGSVCAAALMYCHHLIWH